MLKETDEQINKYIQELSADNDREEQSSLRKSPWEGNDYFIKQFMAGFCNVPEWVTFKQQLK